MCGIRALTLPVAVSGNDLPSRDQAVDGWGFPPPEVQARVTICVAGSLRQSAVGGVFVNDH